MILLIRRRPIPRLCSRGADLRADPGLPIPLGLIDIGWLQDHVTGYPGPACPAAQRDRAGPGRAERGEHPLRRWA
jgi:hypothetical protein